MIFSALLEGVRLAAAFNPFASVAAAVVAAVLLARKPKVVRWTLASLVLFGCWYAGDGIAIVAKWGVRGYSQLATASTATFAIWMLGGFAFGYVLPTWAGVFVGRRVTIGTGWISAGVVAATVSTALAALVGGRG